MYIYVSQFKQLILRQNEEYVKHSAKNILLHCLQYVHTQM